jgi:hypothetical protein
MSEYAAEFIHPDSVGDTEACARFTESGQALLSPLYHEGRLTGYQIIVIESAQDGRDELVPPQADAVTRGRFPYVFLRVQTADDEPATTLIEPLGCIAV